jgi:CHAT domain-containing protein
VGAGRAVSVAPSAALWLRAAQGRAQPSAGGLLLAAGPGLPHAAAEVLALAERHPAADHLAPADARVCAVASALERAGRAHIASHGTFRADNPLFSALLLADGPLTVYDLERLRAAPRDMVLSACDGGMSAVRPGDELMGFSAALLALGTSALVASVVPVPDEPTHRLMLALHERLAAGARAGGRARRRARRRRRRLRRRGRLRLLRGRLGRGLTVTGEAAERFPGSAGRGGEDVASRPWPVRSFASPAPPASSATRPRAG